MCLERLVLEEKEAKECVHHEPLKLPPRHDLRKVRVDKSDPDFKDVLDDPDLKLD